MSIQTDIDGLIGGISVFSLALNVAGIINNKKNVALYTKNEQTGANEDILESGSILGNIDRYSGLIGVTPAIIDAEVTETCRLAEHPLENGRVRADNKIIMPTEIVVKIALPAEQYEDIWNHIKELKDKNTMIWVQTKNEIYKNMQIIAMPFSLNVNNVSRITFSLRLKEVLESQTYAIAKTAGVADVDTVSIGEVSGKTTSLSQFQIKFNYVE